MDADLRGSQHYADVEAWLRSALEPGFGRPQAAVDLDVTADGSRAVFAAPVMTTLEEPARSRIYAVDTATGELTELVAGPGDATLPHLSPDGATLSFLSDRGRAECFALHLLAPDGGLVAVETAGTVEWHGWSPDGSRILLLVAGMGAEQAGVLGARGPAADDDRPPWLPAVRSTDDQTRWRRLWTYDVTSAVTAPASLEGLTVWEACWAGSDALAVVSPEPGEGAWYTATLARIVLADTAVSTVHAPRRQLGWPAASPSGRRLAVVEAVCSDRRVVAGDALLVTPDEAARRIDLGGVDATRLRWLDETRLFYAGLRGLDAVVGCVDVDSGEVDEWWCGEEGSTTYVDALPVGPRQALLAADTLTRPPELAVVGDGWRTVTSFATEGSPVIAGAVDVQRRRWTSSDGLEIEGLLVLPTRGEAPYATVLGVHGGPIGISRSHWHPGLVALLASRGYAVLLPNPRGSQGRGQEFAAAVIGDLGGMEVDDDLSGLDALVAEGLADPARLGVHGGSHGGFMTAWLVTRTDRFAAAVAAVPICDWVSTYWTTNIAAFCTIFLGGTPTEIPDVYLDRSPVTHAARVATPTFLWAGAEDRCCPPSQAAEMFQALEEAGVPSALAVYPGEGHGVRKYPAAVDVLARTLGWFDQWMPA